MSYRPYLVANGSLHVKGAVVATGLCNGRQMKRRSAINSLYTPWHATLHLVGPSIESTRPTARPPRTGIYPAAGRATSQLTDGIATRPKGLVVHCTFSLHRSAPWPADRVPHAGTGDLALRSASGRMTVRTSSTRLHMSVGRSVVCIGSNRILAIAKLD
jgi:hypothetical protein